MAELQESMTDESWKQSLRSEIITALTESGQTKNQALEQVGYYYQCCAPAFLYKYYKDQSLNLDSVMSNKMWYSAPCNFNDAFDCDVAINDKLFSITFCPSFPVAERFAKVVLHGFSTKAACISKLKFYRNSLRAKKSLWG